MGPFVCPRGTLLLEYLSQKVLSVLFLLKPGEVHPSLFPAFVFLFQSSFCALQCILWMMANGGEATA